MTDVNDSLLFELKQHAFFESMSDQAMRDMIALTQNKIFKVRSTIFNQGDEGESLYIILSGRVKISTMSSAGKETVLCFMGPGDVLGEIAVLDGDTRTASAVVIEETQTLILHQGAFLSFLEKHPKVALHIIKVLCGRLRKTDQFVEEMTTLQAGPRLAKALLRLADQYGRPAGTDGSVLINIKLSQANLGAHAGLMRENVNRQLKMWEEEGILRSESGMITLTQMHELKAIAESFQ